MDEKELHNLKERIDKAQQDLSKEQGILESATNQLKELGADTVEDADEHIQQLDAEIRDLEERLETQIREIHAGLGGDED
jgi:chromosome segregation ATPase